jgi:6-pyruvoyltetrahydropterin/6-carboxytetrahydropterin synthase
MNAQHLAELITGVTRQLDHYYLNDIPGLENPSGENIAYWMWQRLKPQCPQLKEIILKRESCGIFITFAGQMADLP